ncbi:MAG TPA: acyl-CoA dehydrogenase family protein [Vulgatibacter sp.]
MDFELNEHQTAIRDAARAYAREKLAPGARDRDRNEAFPAKELGEMAGLGLMGVNVPEELGGAEAGAIAYSLAMTEIAAGDASAAVTMGVTNMCAELICRAGSEEQKRRYVPRLTSGEYVAGAFALSEPQAGSDPSAMATFAERKGDRWVLNGAKQWITSGDVAGVMVVWARTSKAPGSKGISCFLVEGGTKGLLVGKAEDKMGLRASHTVPLTFEDCEIPAENLMGAEGDGFKWAMIALDGGRIGIGSQALGIGRAALEASVAYAKDRKAFGHPIADFQGVSFKLADMKTELDAARLLTLRAAWLKENGRPFTREASMAKVFASEAVNRVVAQAVQIHGGYGYVDEFPVERHLRDARVTTIYEGTSEIQRVVIAREILR